MRLVGSVCLCVWFAVCVRVVWCGVFGGVRF